MVSQLLKVARMRIQCLFGTLNAQGRESTSLQTETVEHELMIS